MPELNGLSMQSKDNREERKSTLNSTASLLLRYKRFRRRPSPSFVSLSLGPVRSLKRRHCCHGQRLDPSVSIPANLVRQRDDDVSVCSGVKGNLVGGTKRLFKLSSNASSRIKSQESARRTLTSTRLKVFRSLHSRTERLQGLTR